MANETENTHELVRSTIRRVIDSAGALSGEERSDVVEMLKDLEAMEAKITSGRVDIAVFGDISKGKSSLINAIIGRPVARTDIRGGTTIEIGGWSWDSCGYQMEGMESSKVYLIDTPGLHEVNGQQRAMLATEAARRADLILFLVDGDLTEGEFEALTELVGSHKPVLLAVNKIDRYTTKDREALLETLRRRVEGLIEPDDVLPVAADPAERDYIYVQPDGSEIEQRRKPSPSLANLKARITEVLDREGKALVWLNASMNAAEINDRLIALKVEIRDKEAETLIWTRAALKAAAVATNPIPVLDIIGGAGVDVSMVISLAKLYGVELSAAQAKSLIVTIGQYAGGLIAVEWVTHFASSFIKTLTLGLSTLVTAVPQGAAAGLMTIVYGRVVKAYLENNGSWGEGGPRHVIAGIVSEIEQDKQSIMKNLQGSIKERLNEGNWHKTRKKRNPVTE